MFLVQVYSKSVTYVLKKYSILNIYMYIYNYVICIYIINIKMKGIREHSLAGVRNSCCIILILSHRNASELLLSHVW